MDKQQVRLNRERRTIQLMIALYCRGQHATSEELCAECDALRSYAMQRVDKCPFREDKPTCAKCPVHCYKPEMRERVRRVMRYAGPRMMLAHPLLTVQHFIDEWSRKRVQRKQMPGNSRSKKETADK